MSKALRASSVATSPSPKASSAQSLTSSKKKQGESLKKTFHEAHAARGDSAKKAVKAAAVEDEELDEDQMDTEENTNSTAAVPGEDDAEEDDVDPVEFAIVAERLERERQQKDGKPSKPSSKNESSSSSSSASSAYSANSAALRTLLNDFAFPASTPWIETLTVTTEKPISEFLSDVNNDIEREGLFYDRSLTAARQCLSQLSSLSIPVERPSDYFAEMLKPDSHMEKIRQTLMIEKKKIESVKERKRKREEKFAKKGVAQEKKREKEQNKLDKLEKNIRKKNQKDENELKVERSNIPLIDDALNATKEHDDERQHSNNTEENDSDGRPAKRSRPSSSPSRALKGPRGPDQKSSKRRHKDKKYGHGGPKRFGKINSRESASDMSGYSGRKNKQNFAGFGKKKGGFKGRGKK